jgi:hypothetical protein
MFDQSLIDEVLATFGYRRRKRFVYQAQWSGPEVEHYLSFSQYGQAKAFLTARFGFRNPHAEQFSVNCIRAYGGDLFRIFKPTGLNGADCTMSFSFGRLGPKVHRWSLYLPDLSNSELEENIRDCLQGRLLPVVRHITNLGELLTRLSADTEPCPWISTNGAMRAAQIVALGEQIGLETEQVRAILKPHKKYIGRDLSEMSGRKVDVHWYVNKIIGEWESFSQNVNPLAQKPGSRDGSSSIQ